MAKNRTKRVDSKQSTGPRRQRELLTSSVCSEHKTLAVRTKLLPGGKYKHECWKCILNGKPAKRPKIVITDITGAKLLDLLLRG